MEEPRIEAPKQDKKILRIVAASLLSLLLTLFFFAASAAALVHFGVFSVNGFKRLVREDYYYSVYNDFISEAEDYTIPTNIEIWVLQDVYISEESSADVDAYIYAAFNGEEFTPDLSEEDARLMANLKTFFTENEVEMDGELEEICNQYIKEIGEIYCKKMKMPGMDLIMNVRNRYSKLLVIGLCVFTAISVGLAVLIVKIFPKAYHGLRFIVYSAGANALMWLAAPAALYYSESYMRLNLAPEYFYRFVVGFVKHLLELCLLAGVIWLGITALTVGFVILAKHISKKKTVSIIQEES